MWSKLFESADLLSLPVLVMFFFIAVFVSVILIALSRKKTEHYAAMSRMPLEDEQ